MRNYRNGEKDYGPPFPHKDLRPCLTKIGFGGVCVAITWTPHGPAAIPAPSTLIVAERKP